MTNRIADNIQKSHDRVADSYGLLHVTEGVSDNSYDAWNLRKNVVKPLKMITSEHWMRGNILDAGCGNGQIAEILLNQGVRRITGVDFSSKMLRNAVKRLRLRKRSSDFNPVRADLESLDMLKPAVFDGAILFGVVEHLDSPEKVIENIISLLKPGGVFALAVPRKGSLGHLSYILFGESPKRWGCEKHWYDRFRFYEKANYYRFFRYADMKKIISGISGVTIIKRYPFSYCHLDGLPGFVLRFAGRNRLVGHRLLDYMDHICKCLGFIPAGEFWLIRKMNQSDNPGKSPGSRPSS